MHAGLGRAHNVPLAQLTAASNSFESREFERAGDPQWSLKAALAC